MEWKWPFAREEKTLALGLDPVTARWLTFGTSSASTAASALALYEESTTVSVPVSWIADAFALVEPTLKDTRDGSFDSSAEPIGLLRRPHPEYTGVTFRKHLATNFLVTGEVGAIASGIFTNPPVAIQPISPKDYFPNVGAGNSADSYRVDGLTANGTYHREVDIRKKTVRYLGEQFREFRQGRGFSTKDNGLLRGQSPLLQAADLVRQHVLTGEHNVSILENGGRVSLLFHFNKVMREDQFQIEKKRILAAYSGPSQAGAVAVTSGNELEIKEMGGAAKDMDFANLQEQVRMACLLVYHFPLALAFLQAATLDNYRIGKFALYDDAVLPLAVSIYDFLSDFLLPRYNIDPSRFRITFDPRTIPALETRMLERIKLRTELRLETLDQLRTTGLGIGPYEPGENPTEGEVIYAPSNLVALGKDPLGSDPFAGLLPEPPDTGSGHLDDDDDPDEGDGDGE